MDVGTINTSIMFTSSRELMLGDVDVSEFPNPLLFLFSTQSFRHTIHYRFLVVSCKVVSIEALIRISKQA